MYISSPQIALGLELSEEQVRKDLALISKSCGKPKTGRSVETLIMDLEEYLGYKNISKAVIVGAGHLGSALIASNRRSTHIRDKRRHLCCSFRWYMRSRAFHRSLFRRKAFRGAYKMP